jgi:FtsP/CotA-like multicopper oxidase with cupredoxin domain
MIFGLWLGLVPRADSHPHPRHAPSREPEPIVANSNRISGGQLRNGVLTIRLQVRTGLLRPQADTGPGILLQAFGEAGKPLQVPGPLLRVVEGTVVHASVHNTLADSPLVLRGLQSRPGSPDDTLQIAPGATRDVRFTAGAPGTYYYWGTTSGSAMGDDRWVDSQLSGAFIVDPAGAPPRESERIFVIGLGLKPRDARAGEPEREFMVINGKSWPDTERLDYSLGDTVRWRWVNASSSSHPMHLHGFYYEVNSRGSWAADTVYRPEMRRQVVTELMPPGGTMSARWVAARTGNWVFHCHFAFHISNHLFLAPGTAGADGQTGEGSGGGAGHAMVGHSMAGLVLGIHVRAGSGSALSAPTAGEPQRFRLIVRPAHAPADSAHLMSYALEPNDRHAAQDPVRIPGPLLTLERGRAVRITVVNRLDEPTAVHWHGIELESYPDGVPGWSGAPGRVFQPIAPGDSFTAEFTPPRAGSFMYHAHADELIQIFGGLYGPLVVVEPGETFDTAANRLVMVGALFRGDSLRGVVNGRLDPATMELRAGRTYRFRLFNIGDARTAFTLRRPDSSVVPWRAVAKDGAELPRAQAVARTEPTMTGPGEIVDFELNAGPPGDLVLDLDAPFAPWRLGVPVRIR